MLKRILSIVTVLTIMISVNAAAQYGNLNKIHDKNFSSAPGEKLVVEALAADVNVKSGGSDVDIKVYGNDNAEEYLDYTFEKRDYGVYVKIERKDDAPRSLRLSLKMDVTVPSKYNTDIKTSGGDIEHRNISGTFKLKTSGGDIVLKDCGGTTDAKTSGGDIDITGYDGKADVSTSGGDIVLKSFTGDTDVSTSGGDIEISGANGEVDASTSGGDIVVDYSGSNYGMDLATSGGDITIYVPAETKASLTLKSTGGDLECDLPNTTIKTKKKFKLVAEVNGGGPEIEASTSGGDIEVKAK